MKDYYYFLGIEDNASAEDIRKAYRKLSMKYHPDKNNDDAFFQKRFREIQEAYDTLISEESRKMYDENLGKIQKTNRSNLPPYIKTFSSNKVRVQKGEEVVINWQTNNADLVKILPFGLEKAYGERTFKITEFKDGKFHVVLQATNTLISKSVVKGITITEIFAKEENQSENQSTNQFEATYIPPKKNQVKDEKVKPVWRTLLILVILIMLTIYLFLQN